jgi:hypothetical protein
MTGYSVTPTLQGNVYPALLALITSVTGLPASNVVQGRPNRASMPMPGFVSVQALFDRRLRTNVDTWDETDPSPTTQTLEQGLELTVQIDCFGPQSHDWANMLSTILRDEVGCNALAPSCQPLYADEARMIALVDGEEQYEERWALDAKLQMNPITTVPQQYADVLELTLINVPEKFPT